ELERAGEAPAKENAVETRSIDDVDHEEKRGDPPCRRNPQGDLGGLAGPPQRNDQEQREEPTRGPDQGGFVELLIRSDVGAEPHRGVPSESAYKVKRQHGEKLERAS